MKARYREEEGDVNYGVGRLFFTILFTAFILVGLYSYFQYKEGKSLAKGNGIDPGPFQGDVIDPKNPSVENYLLLGIDDDGSANQELIR